MGAKENKGVFTGTSDAAIELFDNSKEGKVAFEVGIVGGPPAKGRPLRKYHSGRHSKETPSSTRSSNEEAHQPNPSAEGDSKFHH